VGTWRKIIEQIIGVPVTGRQREESPQRDQIVEPSFDLRGLPFAAGTPLMPQDNVFVVDSSGSMDDADFKPSRLEGAKMAVQATIEMRRAVSKDDRVAIVSFTEQAKVLCELTDIIKTGRAIDRLAGLEASGGTDIAAGLNAVRDILMCDPLIGLGPRLRRVLLLTDGHGGEPLKIASELKTRGQVFIAVVGVGGDPSSVNEKQLRRVATTDRDGFNHYRFIKDTSTLVEHYKSLASGLVWKGPAT
jgi:uncharacterized protein YegL